VQLPPTGPADEDEEVEHASQFPQVEDHDIAATVLSGHSRSDLGPAKPTVIVLDNGRWRNGIGLCHGIGSLEGLRGELKQPLYTAAESAGGSLRTTVSIPFADHPPCAERDNQCHGESAITAEILAIVTVELFG